MVKIQVGWFHFFPSGIVSLQILTSFLTGWKGRKFAYVRSIIAKYRVQVIFCEVRAVKFKVDFASCTTVGHIEIIFFFQFCEWKNQPITNLFLLLCSKPRNQTPPNYLKPNSLTLYTTKPIKNSLAVRRTLRIQRNTVNLKTS